MYLTNVCCLLRTLSSSRIKKQSPSTKQEQFWSFWKWAVIREELFQYFSFLGGRSDQLPKNFFCLILIVYFLRQVQLQRFNWHVSKTNKTNLIIQPRPELNEFCFVLFYYFIYRRRLDQDSLNQIPNLRLYRMLSTRWGLCNVFGLKI